MYDLRHSNGVQLTLRAIRACSVKLLAPVSFDEDSRRKEFILNVILVISIPFLVILDATIARNTIHLAKHYHGIPFWIFTLVVLLFIGLFVASKYGYARPASFVLIGIYTLGGLYSGWHWGASLPATLLTLVLVSVISSILIGSRFGFCMALSLIIILVILALREIKILGTLPWKYQTITHIDILIYTVLLFFIASLSWLSNREIQKSLDRARASEKSLAHERDNLEIKVAQRTNDLRKAQEEQVAELSQKAEFGKLAQGLFHDLMTPLTSVALHMETLRDATHPEIQNSRAYVEKAMRASERMGIFMNTIRRSIRSSATQPTTSSATTETVNLEHELSEAIVLLSHRARSADVDIKSVIHSPINHKGVSFHFLQIFLNLISNGIDATEKNTGEKTITVELREETDPTHIKQIYIIVSDNGSGIPLINQSKIFNDFYTTKSSHGGIGLGLSTVKKIVENELHGSIDVKSVTDIGTTFTIIFPSQ